MLFEEAFGISLVRTLRHAMEDHPILVVSKVPLDRSRTPVRRLAGIEVEVGDRVQRSGTVPVRARMTNRGSATWHAVSRSGTGHVRLGIQLLDEAGRLLARDYHRVALPQDVAPGTSIDVSFTCPAPDSPGMYLLKFDLVAEGVTWFETAGSPIVTRRTTVL
jgi:hypothetical protein